MGVPPKSSSTLDWEVPSQINHHKPSSSWETGRSTDQPLFSISAHQLAQVINSISAGNPGLWPLMVFFMALVPWPQTNPPVESLGNRADRGVISMGKFTAVLYMKMDVAAG